MPVAELKRFECSIKDAPLGEHWSTVHAFTRGQAKNSYWRHVIDAWQGIPYTAVRCRQAGKPLDTEKFLHTAKYRNIALHIGSKVEYGGKVGSVVDSDSSANFEVLFPDGSRIHLHPSEVRICQ